MESRWQNYFLKKGEEFHLFWKSYLKNQKKLLFILGQGFDPRMCLGPEAILKIDEKGVRDFIIIEFKEGDNSPSRDYKNEVMVNLQTLNDLINGKGTQKTITIDMETADGHKVGARYAADIFTNLADFDKYTDIIVDITALPFNIYFPLIGKILFILDSAKSTGQKDKIPNLHVLVTENAVIDKSIKKSGLDDDAQHLHGFTGGLEVSSREEIPTIWMPILGESQKEQIELIDTFITPAEICPVLPSPSTNPRRGDELVLEYRDLLMNRLAVESRNIIYADEQNPFEVYRQILRTVYHYRDALRPLGGCKVAISSLSSKLMSMGAFLVAYEEGISKKQNVGMVYVESKGYSMKKTATNGSTLANSDLFTLWISGECYES